MEGWPSLQDFAADAIELYPRCRAQGMRWILVEARERRIMPETPPTSADGPCASCAGARHRDPRGTTLETPTAASARSGDGEAGPTRTCVWTAGVQPHPVVASSACRSIDGGRIEVAPPRRACAAGRERGGRSATRPPCPTPPARSCKGRRPPTDAQHAIRQGRRVGRNVAARSAGGRARPFRYKTKGVFVDMGRGRRWRARWGSSGAGVRPPGLLARTYHLAMMPGLKRRARGCSSTGTSELLFGRDASELGRSAIRWGGRADGGRASAPASAAPRPGDGAPRRGARRGAGGDAGPPILGEDDAGRQGEQDLTTAMKAGRSDRVGTLRFVLSELQKAAKEGATTSSPSCAASASAAWSPPRRSARAAGTTWPPPRRPRRALIEAYLPAELSDEELRAIVADAVVETGATGTEDMGAVMRAAMEQVGGRADGRRVSALAQEALKGAPA